METPKYVIEIHTDNFQAAMHFYQYARRHGYKTKVLDCTDEEKEPKEVAHFRGIPR